MIKRAAKKIFSLPTTALKHNETLFLQERVVDSFLCCTWSFLDFAHFHLDEPQGLWISSCCWWFSGGMCVGLFVQFWPEMDYFFKTFILALVSYLVSAMIATFFFSRTVKVQQCVPSVPSQSFLM
jgi:hypothetical protein